VNEGERGSGKGEGARAERHPSPFPVPSSPKVIRDPLWNNIRLEPSALAVVDTRAFQRLRYVRQLGHAFLVYPGATHSRFEHALGTYHLARRTLARLEETLGGPPVSREEAERLKLAALLHDIGHYPFSHALEEAGLAHHEALAARHLTTGDLAGVLERLGVAPADLLPIIRGESPGPLAGIVSGSVDVDKLDYLSRDAHGCGVPYGIIDVDRLLASLTVAPGPEGRPTLALSEKGLAPLESLLFAKYQMYRNVYWHHAVRAATAMFKRLVRRAIGDGRVAQDAVALATDDGLIHELQQSDRTGLARALRERRLAKRALDLPATDLPDCPADWPARDPDLLEVVEDRIAAEVGLAPGEVLLDLPGKPGMLDLDLPLARRDGSVVRLTGAAAGGWLGLPRVAGELYRAARRLRVFTLAPASLPARAIVALLEGSAEELRARLAAGRALIT
jgi:HD superfamily phosphohydrolase